MDDAIGVSQSQRAITRSVAIVAHDEIGFQEASLRRHGAEERNTKERRNCQKSVDVVHKVIPLFLNIVFVPACSRDFVVPKAVPGRKSH
jgi:hypothetical protein